MTILTEFSKKYFGNVTANTIDYFNTLIIQNATVNVDNCVVKMPFCTIIPQYQQLQFCQCFYVFNAVHVFV